MESTLAFSSRSIAVLFALIAVDSVTTHGVAADRPNLLWITVEDMSPTLGCYGDEYAHTPILDSFARQSVRYTNAMASAPVCSPSRSCLIHGCLATSSGTHNMRSQFPLPAKMKGFPSLLREAGYFTSNNVKTDYNCAGEDEIVQSSWDRSTPQADWRMRADHESFFSVVNLMTTHQSRTMVWDESQFRDEIQSLLKKDEIHDPSRAPLPPYYPDTELIRKTVARYYDCVTVMDHQVGEILDKLEADGLSDDTIVFFYSDHGSGMPRHKRVLLDSGMRVALMIRFPEKYRHLAPAGPGETVDRLVCFDDYAPTVLRLAGIEDVPDWITGVSFLADDRATPREYVYGHRDRIDEVIDMARSVRDKRYLYIRNFMPHLSYNQPSNWVDDSEMIHDFYRAADDPELTDAQRHFLSATRPVEELYDCQSDPDNLVNLVDSRRHETVRAKMRRELCRHLLASRDLGFLPEPVQREVAAQAIPMEWARGDSYRLKQISEVAWQIGGPAEKFIGSLDDADVAVRYWSAVGLSAATVLDRPCVTALLNALEDPAPIVRIEAATALVRHGRPSSEEVVAALATLGGILGDDDPGVLLRAARAVELLGDRAASLHGPMSSLATRFADAPGDDAWFIRFTTNGYLQRVPPAP